MDTASGQRTSSQCPNCEADFNGQAYSCACKSSVFPISRTMGFFLFPNVKRAFKVTNKNGRVVKDTGNR